MERIQLFCSEPDLDFDNNCSDDHPLYRHLCAIFCRNSDGKELNSEEFMAILFAGLAFDFVLIVLVVCFHTLVMFAFPLVVDRNLSAFQAIKLSMKAVWANLSGIAGMMGIQFVASIVVTFATCGIGAYFAIPIMFGGLVVAYRKVFPSMTPMNFAPPTPDNFREAGTYL